MTKWFIGLCVAASAVMVFLSLGSNSQLPNYPTTQIEPVTPGLRSVVRSTGMVHHSAVGRINRSVTTYSKSNPNDRARYEADGGTLWDGPTITCAPMGAAASSGFPRCAD